MILSQLFGGPEIRSIRRPVVHRRPRVESLEGRQFLTTLLTPAIGIVGNHIGTSAMVQGAHIGTRAMIQGGHPGAGIAGVMIKR